MATGDMSHACYFFMKQNVPQVIEFFCLKMSEKREILKTLAGYVLTALRHNNPATAAKILDNVKDEMVPELYYAQAKYLYYKGRFFLVDIPDIVLNKLIKYIILGEIKEMLVALERALSTDQATIRNVLRFLYQMADPDQSSKKK